MNGLKDRHGRGAVLLASIGTAGMHQRWTMRQQLRTPDYATRWSDLPMVKVVEAGSFARARRDA